jgi:predicted transcriptional regulator
MKTLRVGIATREQQRHRVEGQSAGPPEIHQDDPEVWFPSTESFAKILSADNRALLRAISERSPTSLDELAQITGRAKSNLSRTLKTMASYRLVHLHRGERGRLTPTVPHDTVALELPLTV